MFLYTIIPLEYIFEDDEDEELQKPATNTEVEIKRGNASLMVSSVEGGQAKISRIISTDPRDFLNPNWQPGVIIPQS